MLNRIKQITWQQWLTVGTLFVIGTALPACAGKFVKVRTPERAVDQGYPAKLNYDDSREAFAEKIRSDIATNEIWQDRIETAGQKVAMIEGIGGAVLSPESLAMWGLNPAGGAGASLMYLLGLFTKRPGDSSPKQTAKEKEDSYNKGVEVTSTLLNGDKSDPQQA